MFIIEITEKTNLGTQLMVGPMSFEQAEEWLKENGFGYVPNPPRGYLNSCYIGSPREYWQLDSTHRIIIDQKPLDCISYMQAVICKLTAPGTLTFKEFVPAQS